MNAETIDRLERVEMMKTPTDRLREPFPPEQVGKLPRNNGRVILDYVGHGAVTSRLLEVDPNWNWEPLAKNDDGTPKFDEDADGNYVGLWIALTVAGVTRLGYGSVPAGTQDAVKQLIGDAIRNAAMRFGVALDLWIKGHVPEDDERNVPDAKRASGRSPSTDSTVGSVAAEALYKSGEKAGVDRKTLNGIAKSIAGVDTVAQIPRTQWDMMRDAYAVHLQEAKLNVPPAQGSSFPPEGPSVPADDDASEVSTGVRPPQDGPAGGAALGSRSKKAQS